MKVKDLIEVLKDFNDWDIEILDLINFKKSRIN